MLRFRKIFLLLLLTALLASPRPSSAALIITYDLDSLCFMSTDVVEATLTRHHVAGQEEWNDTITATVVTPLLGHYRAGDKIGSRDLTLYEPSADGQRCILFIARNQFYYHLTPAEAIAPRVMDMLWIDKYDRVRRYYQWGNPGGLVAEGYSSPALFVRGIDKKGMVFYHEGPKQEDDSAEQVFPTLLSELDTIRTKWASIAWIRPLLSRRPNPEDIPVLMSLLRERRVLNQEYYPFRPFGDLIFRAIYDRLTLLKDPILTLNAMAIAQGSSTQWSYVYNDNVFSTVSSIQLLKAVLTTPYETVDRRIAAAEVLWDDDWVPENGKQIKEANRAAIIALALDSHSPEQMRLTLISHLDLGQTHIAAALQDAYHQTHSQEIQFEIEKLFLLQGGSPGDSHYASLHSTTGPITSIVRLSTYPEAEPGHILLHSEIMRTRAAQSFDSSQTYLFTNSATGNKYRVSGERQNHWNAEVQEQQVPLPNLLPQGIYQIALEFRDNGRLISIGHFVTMKLP